MFRARVFFAVAVGVLAAAMLGAAAPAGADSGNARPMSGSCTTNFTLVGLQISIAGTCQLTHLGKAAYEATQTITPNPDGTVSITVTGFYTAANGDTLRSTLAGIGRFTPSGQVTYSTTETYTGGTGRFAGARGTASDTGVAAFTGPTTGTSDYTTVGSISY
jgi:hypothetical protein